MAATIVQSKSGTNNTGNATVTVTWDTPATAGNVLIITTGSDDYKLSTAAGTPSGFTLVTGGAQETNLGHYMWYKVAAGGETSASFTIGSAATWCWVTLEVSGLTGTPFDLSNGQKQLGSSTTYTTPTITPTAGDRFLVAAIGGALNNAFSGVDTWTNSFVELQDVFTTLTSPATRDQIGVATRAVTADGATGYSTGATFSGAVTAQAETGILAAFKVASAGGGTAYTRTVSDTAGLVDSNNPQKTTGGTAYTRAVTDAVGPTDTGSPQALDTGDTLTDTTGITDTANPQLTVGSTAHVRTVNEAAGIADTASPATASAGAQQVGDAAGLTDSITVALASVRTVNDLLNLIDQAGPAGNNYTRTTGDSIGAGDTTTSHIVDTANLVDISITLGQPQRAWAAGNPTRQQWTAGPPNRSAWAAGPPTTK